MRFGPGDAVKAAAADGASTAWRTRKWEQAGKPRLLPLELSLDDLGLSIEFLRSSLGTESAHGKPFTDDPEERKVGFFNPPFGRMIGMALAPRIGALLSRPGCSFSNSFLWQYDRGSDMALHVDRAPLDITMSVPLTLDGVDAWPVSVQQPEGDIVTWASQPGSVLLFDGRWRPHWRAVFEGRRSEVLLLHWRAPAVLWPDLVDADCRERLRPDALPPELVENSAALARMAAPQAATPEFQLVDLRAKTLPEGKDKQSVLVLAPIEDALTLTFDRAQMTVAPGDGVAFASRDRCLLDWSSGDDAGRVLVGRAHAPDPDDAPAATY